MIQVVHPATVKQLSISQYPRRPVVGWTRTRGPFELSLKGDQLGLLFQVVQKWRHQQCNPRMSYFDKRRKLKNHCFFCVFSIFAAYRNKSYADCIARAGASGQLEGSPELALSAMSARMESQELVKAPNTSIFRAKSQGFASVGAVGRIEHMLGTPESKPKSS